MNRVIGLLLSAVITTASVCAAPVWEGDWSRIRRYGHGQDRNMFSAEQLAYIDDHIAYLTLEKIHGSDVFSGGNLDQSTIATADLLQNTKVLLYLQAFYAWQRYTAIYDMDRASYPDLFVPDGGMDPFAYNQGTAAGRAFWKKLSDDIINNSNVVGTYVDAIGKIDTHGHSEWMPEFKKTLSQLDGLTIINGHPGGLIDHCEGFMREDIVKETPSEIRDNLDAYIVIPKDKHMFFNSFNADYEYALSAFLIVAHEKSFFRYFPLAPDLSNNSARWADVLWHCEEYDKPLGPPKGSGVRTGDWIYERSFEYADVRLDLENTNSVITWHEAPVAHWTMEDGSGTVVSDVSGNGHDGTLSGGAWVNGPRGGALEFNGSTSSDSVSIPADVFVAVTNEITVSMWVKGDAAEQPRDDSVFQALDASGRPLLNIQLPSADSQVVWDAGNSGGYDRMVKTASTADFEGQWNHWSFTKNAASGTMNIYLNGALWQSGSGNTTPMNGVVEKACFGSGAGADSYEGTLDDVRIYNRVLSAGEIAVLAATRPVAHPDTISVDEDASVAITLSGSDADGHAGTPLTYIVGVPPANGTLSGAVPNLTYTPDADFFGSDRFYFFVNDGVTNSYAAEVSITVNGVQDMPVAIAQSIVVRAGEPLGITLNGTDADGDSLTYTVVTDPVNGTLSGTAPNLTYTPEAGYLGNDSFTFKVNDGLEDSVPATVTILVSENVTDVIAAYDFDDGSGTATTNATLSDPNVTVSHFGVGTGLNEIVDQSGSSLAEDLDAENRFFGTANPISYGGGRDSLGFLRLGSLSSAIASNDYMTFTITPSGGAAMDLSRFTFRTWIETSTESANAWALFSSVDGFDQADAIAAGQTAAAGEWTGHVIDLSATRFQGLEEAVEFRLYIHDGRNNSGSLTLFDKVILHGTVSPGPNQAPAADSLSILSGAGMPVNFTLTGSDPEGSSLSFTVESDPAHGALSGEAPNLTYTPTNGYAGTDSFTFTVSDGETNSAIATVWITVNSFAAADQTLNVKMNGSQAVTLSGRDTAGGRLGYTLSSGPAHGSLSGTEPYLTYTPDADYSGSDSFTFVVTDGHTVSGPATVSIEVIDPSLWITWNDPEDISGEGDVSTNGSPVWAYSFGAAGSFLVNGVMFAGESRPGGNADVSTSLDQSYAGFGNSAGLFSTLPAAYQDILESGAFSSGLNPVITLDGLNAGSGYEVQFWINDSRNRSDMDSKPRTAALAETAYEVDYNTAGAGTNDGLGQSIIGTFTAASTTQTIELQTVVPQLNAIQLRWLSAPGTNPDLYSIWAAGHGLTGADSLYAGDTENGGMGDGCNNLWEFALGMDPTISDAGSRDWIKTSSEGGTNWFDYVHYRRTNHVAEGLDYLLIDSTNLVNAVSRTNAQDQILVGPAVDGYEPVTNRYNTGEAVKFIQLRILQH